MAKWQKPFPDSTITGHFGKVRTFKGAPTNPHRGTDWAPGAEKIIPNITSGTVALIKWSNIMGWGIVIKTDDKDSDGKPWYISYHHLHCAKHGINCKGPQVHGEHSPFTNTNEGDHKETGEPVGRIGNTGSASSGPHGHFCASKTLTGAWSGTVIDLYALIEKKSKEAPKPAAKTKVEPQVTKHECVCEHCGKKWMKD